MRTTDSLPHNARRDPSRESPWRDLEKAVPYALQTDRAAIEAYNAKAKPSGKIHLEIPPNPYVGSFQTARVVILTKSPSWDENNITEYADDPAYAEAMWQSLTFGVTDLSFYFINPAFSRTCGYQWWHPYLEKLIEACEEKAPSRGLRCVAQGLFSVAFFPYHVNDYTKRAGAEELGCQKFAKNLVSELRREGVPVVITSGSREWTAALPKLNGYAPKTNSPQSAYITPGNLPDGVFESLVDRLTAA